MTLTACSRMQFTSRCGLMIAHRYRTKVTVQASISSEPHSNVQPPITVDQASITIVQPSIFIDQASGSTIQPSISIHQDPTLQQPSLAIESFNISLSFAEPRPVPQPVQAALVSQVPDLGHLVGMPDEVICKLIGGGTEHTKKLLIDTHGYSYTEKVKHLKRGYRIIWRCSICSSKYTLVKQQSSRMERTSPVVPTTMDIQVDLERISE